MKNYRFLIVEDEYITAMEIEERLSSLGYNKVSIVTDAKEAKEIIKKNIYDVYLLDINLNSEISGFDLVDTIKTYSNPNIIFISAYSDSKTLEKANQIESYGFLRKPFDEKDFYIAIEFALNKIKDEIFSVEKRLESLKEITSIAIIVTSLNGIANIYSGTEYEKKEKLTNELKDILMDSLPINSMVQKKSIGEYVIILREIYLFELEKIVDKIYEKFNNEFSARDKLSLSLGYSKKIDDSKTIFDTYRLAELRLEKNKLKSPFSEMGLIINSLFKAMTEKTDETILHCRRMPALSHILGKELGLSNYEMDDLYLVSRFHDVGKIAVREAILNKKGSLTKKEYEEVKKHSYTGYKIIDSFKKLSDLSEYILYHHERWDGKGYPKGLKGKEIPYLSRIIAVADAYDTMTRGRIYKKAISHDKAIKELKKNSGTQFDPKIIDVVSNIDIEKALENDFKIDVNNYELNYREKIIKQAARFETVKDLCDHFSISRTTYYNWKKEYESDKKTEFDQTMKENKKQKENIMFQKNENSYLKKIIDDRGQIDESIDASKLNDIINNYYRTKK